MKKEKIDYELTLKLRKMTALNGGDLFGVASPQPLAAAPAGFRPQDVMPGSKTEGGHACAICLKVCPVGRRS